MRTDEIILHICWLDKHEVIDDILNIVFVVSSWVEMDGVYSPEDEVDVQLAPNITHGMVTGMLTLTDNGQGND